MDCSPPGSSVYGIFQAKVLEWDAIAFSMTNLDSILKSRDITLLACKMSEGEGNGTPLQYSCLENPMDGGPW